MANAAHGKELLRWCDSCGTLLLGDSCSSCGSPGREFRVNSPGDVRPCMGDSVGVVLSLFREAFGTDAPLRGRSIFLNKVPGEDRADEVVAHGAVVGVVRYGLRERRMLLELRQPGAELFADCATKNVVRFSGMSGHLKGKAVPGANVTEVAGEFSKGDPLILRRGGKVGPGTALADSSELKSQERAVKVRDLLAPSGAPVSPPAGLGEFVACNRSHVRRIQRAAVREIRRFQAEGNPKGLPVTVSFSGGKDSLAACALAAEAVGDVELINIDTGLEFPETTAYVERFARANGFKIHIARGGTGFRDNLDAFGPPAKDFRWCCKVCKLGPVTDLIESEFPEGTVTVEGNRRLESYARSQIGFVTKNPFVPNQVNLNPIRGWSAAEVWAYVLTHRLDYNPLYDRDFERIGCYLCPACLESEWANTRRIHPELHSWWDAELRRYAEERGLPPEFAGLGLWRWKALPPKMVQIVDEMGLDVRPKAQPGPSVRMLKGASPCAAGGYSVEAVVSVPRRRDFSYVEDALRTVGDTRYSDEYEIALLRLPIGRARLFGGGQVSVNSRDARGAKEVFGLAVKALVRAMMCTECGICAKGCPRRAITIDGGMRVDPSRCVACGKCSKSCMVVHYHDRLMEEAEAQGAGDPSCGRNRRCMRASARNP